MVNDICPASLGMGYKWRLVRTFVKGEEDIKRAGEAYLPRKSGQCDGDYRSYKARAKPGDYTNEGLLRLHGMIFRRTPVVDYPSSEELELVIENFNREGDSLYQFASDVAMDNMQTTWGGLLVDMPYSAEVITEYDAQRAGIRPYAKYYPAESIVNWRFRDVNGSQQLAMVVLQEFIDAGEDEFSHGMVCQYRVLDLDSEGYYRVRIFSSVKRKDETGKEVETFEPGNGIYVRVKGERLRYIPFEFLPGKKPDTPMLYGLAELHKHYYMQSADYENGIHYTTIPTGYSTGHTPLKDENGDPEVIRLGGDSWLNFPEPEAKVGNLAFAGEGLEHSEKALATTSEEMGVLGTRMISPDKAMSETKDAAQIHRQGENARLATYARNFSEKFTHALRIMADWLGVEGKVNIEFNVDYDSVAFDPNALNAIANLSREGKFPIPYVYEALKKGEYLPNDCTLEQFILMLAVEDAAVPLADELELYRAIREGKEIAIPSLRNPRTELDDAGEDFGEDVTDGEDGEV